jgi:predicted RNA-binding protein
MNIEITPEDIKRLNKIKRLWGNKEPLDDTIARVIISDALIAYERQLRQGKEGGE